jgi:hypothetical protein
MGISTSRLCDRRTYRGRIDGEYRMRPLGSLAVAHPRRSMPSVVVGGWSDLSSEDRVADDRVDQHEREDEETLAPEHEGETGVGAAASSMVVENGIM